MRRALIIASLALVAMAPLDARAQDVPRPAALEHCACNDPGAPPRWFFSTAVDMGFSYLRPRGSVGWGLPHADWLGLDFNPIVSTSAVGGYAGLRFADGPFNLRIGARYFHSFRSALLEVQDSYDFDEIELRVGALADYLSAETELTLTPRLGPGNLLSESALTYISGVEDGKYVFEETIRAVVAPPWAWRQRLGYFFHLFDAAFRIGPVAEVVGLPGRDAFVVRAGVAARFRANRSIEVRAAFIPVVSSPDVLGISGADVGLLGIRWRWATGE